MRSKRTARAGMALGVLAILAGTLGSTISAQAAPPYQPGDPGSTDVTLPAPPKPCKSGTTWLQQPRVVVHTSEYAGTTAQATMVAAITEINAQIAAIGATSAAVTNTITTTNPFHYGVAYGGNAPTIHVGFVSDLPEPPGSTGTTLASTQPSIPDGPCEAHIAVVETGSSWDYGTPLSSSPAATGQQLYYDAGRSDTYGTDYFRPSYLHELMHAFGLEHTSTAYAFMNYGERPWRRGPSSDAVRPLGDDVRRLRSLYPASGTVTDVSVLNTWFDAQDVSSSNAARERMLCAPSKGATAADEFATRAAGLDDGFATCGRDSTSAGSTNLCAGGSIRSEVAFTNTSTEAVDVQVRYWLSFDDVWNNTDALSPTVPAVVHVNKADSVLIPGTWTIPSVGTPAGLASYHVIARAEATTTSGTTVRDWIPLRGTLTLNRATCHSLP